MKNTTPLTEFLLITVLALALYLPFLAIQYDTNGIAEAIAVENGPLLNRNHLLYRPLGWIVWRSIQLVGYSGNSLLILQSITAIAAALGVGFAYLAFKALAPGRTYPAVGALALGTSYSYWVTGTDVFYIMVAAMFAAAALACTVHARSNAWLAAAGVLSALSILTWKGSVFLPAALLILLPSQRRSLRSAATLAGVAGVVSALGYIAMAFGELGFMGPRALWTWLTRYNDTSTLPFWGAWGVERIGFATVSALNSVVPVRLGVPLNELLKTPQLGRVAVDFSTAGFIAILVLAAVKTRSHALRFVAGYLCFVPFLIWWDPGTHLWFLVPNVFLAGFVLLGLAAWRPRKYVGTLAAAAILFTAATNFITTIRPRHFMTGRDVPMAACVAGHMQPADLFVAAEWGWPDYLGYFHKRSAINLINETAHFGNKTEALEDVRLRIRETIGAGANAFFTDPQHYSQAQLQWLHNTAGLGLDDLAGFSGSPSFVCEGVAIHRLGI